MLPLFLLPSSSEHWILGHRFGSKMVATVPNFLSSSKYVQRQEVNFSLHTSFSLRGKLFPETLLQISPNTSLARTCSSINNHRQMGIELLLLAYTRAGEGHAFPRAQCILICKPTQGSIGKKKGWDVYWLASKRVFPNTLVYPFACMYVCKYIHKTKSLQICWVKKVCSFKMLRDINRRSDKQTMVYT